MFPGSSTFRWLLIYKHTLTKYANGVYSEHDFHRTSIFTKEIQKLISDDNYRMLQTALMLRPDAGSLIRGCGGLRKIRWNLPDTGKRGALRIIYYWDPPDTIFMLFPYRKTEQEDFTPDQLKLLRKMVREFLS